MQNESDQSAQSTELHPRIAEVLGELDASRAELIAFVDTLRPEHIEMPGPDGAWSVAQNLEHLAMVEDGAGRSISKIVREVEGKGTKEHDASSVLQCNERYAIATTEQRVLAPTFVQPMAGLSADDSMAKLSASRVLVKRALVRGSGLALEQATVPHPLFGPFSGYQWAIMIAQHERRHLRQMQRLLANNEGSNTGMTHA